MRLVLVLLLSLHVSFAKELTPVSLQLAWKYQFQFAGYIMAKEKGFYEDVGLDVTIKEYKNGISTSEEIKQKRSDFAIGRSGIILDKMDNDSPFLLLLALAQAEPVILQTIKKNNIQTLQDLKGKTFVSSGDPDFSNLSASVAAMLMSADLKLSDFKHKPSRSYGPEDITNGYGDFITGYSTITPYHLKKMDFEPISFHPKDYGFDFYGDILFTHEDLFANKPEIVDAFYAASIKGWKYAFRHIDESIDVIKAKYDTQELSHDILRFEANAFKELAFSPGTPFGHINPVKIEKIANTFRLVGMSKSTGLGFSSLIYEPLHEGGFRFDPKEKSFIHENPIIRMGIPENFYPFDIKGPKGKHTGLAHELLDILSSKTGFYFEKIYSNIPTLLQKLKNNQIDGIIGIDSAFNHAHIYFTQKFFTLEERLFTRSDTKEKEINTLGIISFIPQNARAKTKETSSFYPQAHVNQYFSIQAGINALEEKRVDALFSPQSSILYAINNEKAKNIRFVNPIQTLPNSTLHIATNDVLLKDILDKSFQTLRTDTLNQLKSKWIPSTLKEPLNLQFYYNILAIIALVFLLLLYRYFLVSKLNKKLQKQEKELVKMHKQLQEQAEQDPLTKLNNRRHFAILTKQVINQAYRAEALVTMLVADLDDFKKVNDTYGHQMGDKVLKDVAKCFQANMRDSDILARFGGEEFVCLLPATDISGARIFAHKIRQAIHSLEFHTNSKMPFHISVSIGLAALDTTKQEDFDSLFKKADDALYEAKKSGKNTVCDFY